LPPSSAKVKNEWSCTLILSVMISWLGQGKLFLLLS
jgi:hypothetical protein